MTDQIRFRLAPSAVEPVHATLTARTVEELTARCLRHPECQKTVIDMAHVGDEGTVEMGAGAMIALDEVLFAWEREAERNGNTAPPDVSVFRANITDALVNLSAP